MNLPFKTVALTSASVALCIAAVLLLAPQLIFSMWQVDFSYPVGLVGRRAAALMIGIGIMLIGARNAAPSVTRAALERGMACALLLLAALGVFELASGHAGPGIFSAVLLEILLALGFVLAMRRTSLSTSTQ